MPTSALLDPARLDRPDTHLRQQPFPHLIAHNQLPEAARAELDQDFPNYPSAGFFPFDAQECGTSIRALVAQATSPAFTAAIGAKLGIDNLGQYPALVTLCKHNNKRFGTIHTDSKSKVATALIYLNPSWHDTSDGCLRFLAKVDDIDATIGPEVKPLYGEVVVFKRAENSFHGYLPYEGERRVIQITWLTSEAEKLRKTRRGLMSRLVKKLVGRLDQWFGAGRDRNAAHMD